MQENPLAKLHDIKSLVQIPDNSFFIFIALVLICILVLISLIFWGIKLYKNRKKSDRKKYFEILESIDFSNSKQAAYLITKYSRLLVRTPREKKLCEELIEELDNFKYKKDVGDIDDTTKAKFSNFMDILDV